MKRRKIKAWLCRDRGAAGAFGLYPGLARDLELPADGTWCSHGPLGMWLRHGEPGDGDSMFPARVVRSVFGYVGPLPARGKKRRVTVSVPEEN